MIPREESLLLTLMAAGCGGVIGFLLCSAIFAGKMALAHLKMARQAMQWKKLIEELQEENRQSSLKIARVLEDYNKWSIELDDLQRRIKVLQTHERQMSVH